MNNKIKHCFVPGVLALLFVGLDQLTKYLAKTFLMNKPPVVLWKGVFELCYVENRGAAFSMLQNQRMLFLVLTPVVLLLLCFYYYRIPKGKRYLPLKGIAVLLFAGAAGNYIDRVFLHYVVDFFYFSLIDFPVFNVADCYVSVAAILLFLFLLFYYKEDELDFLFHPLRSGHGSSDTDD